MQTITPYEMLQLRVKNLEERLDRIEGKQPQPPRKECATKGCTRDAPQCPSLTLCGKCRRAWKEAKEARRKARENNQ